MKILHLTGEFPPYSTGGLGRYVYELTQHQARTDHEVAVLLNRGSKVPPTQPPPADLRTTYHETVLDPDIHEKYSRGVIDPADLERTVPDDTITPDVIHIHDWHGVLPALWLQHTTDAQVVYSAHLPLRAGFTYSGHAVCVGVSEFVPGASTREGIDKKMRKRGEV